MNPSPQPDGQDEKQKASPPLSEKDFIQDRWRWRSFPFWLWIFLMAAAVGIIWGTSGWYQGLIQKEKKDDPFLEVTNREFSVFLWQFPSFMRANASKKTGYLTGFLSTSENIDPAAADEYVSAPPELLFLYHTWDRLLAPGYIPRPIPPTEFSEFLDQLPEWQPSNWEKAPSAYTNMIATKRYSEIENLQTLSQDELPLSVRQAFEGWKNYYHEGTEINNLKPTFAQVVTFLEKHPSYGRSYWRNIGVVEGHKIAGHDYLHPFMERYFDLDAVIPNDELAPFLKVALYNQEQADQGR
jgi:hypothetical protein